MLTLLSRKNLVSNFTQLLLIILIKYIKLMKKLKQTLSILIITLAPFVAFADIQGAYFKGIVGMNKLDDIRNFDDFKQKSAFSPEVSIGAGAGFNFDNSIRAEIMVSYTKVHFHSNCKLSTFYDTSLNTKKTVINTTMLNFYKDFPEVAKNVSVFGGVGFGASQINETIQWKTFFPDRRNPRNINTSKGTTYRKTVYNFTYSIIAGLDFKVSSQLNLELSYNFKNYGLTKPRMVGRVLLDEKLYRSHGIYTGIRYNI